MELKKFLDIIKKLIKDKSLYHIKNELEDYETCFSILVIGSFIGLPIPPLPVIYKILPLMEKDIIKFINKSINLDDSFAQTISKYDLE